jgi:DNA-binding CsgD family transcriptional regulator
MISMHSFSDHSHDTVLRDPVDTECNSWHESSSSTVCCSLSQPPTSLLIESGAGLAVLNTELQILKTNAEFVRHSGQSSSSIIDRNFCELLHPAVRPVLRRQLTRVAQGRTDSVESILILWAYAPGAARAAADSELSGFAADCEANKHRTIIVLIRDKPSAVRLTRSRRNEMLTSMDARILEGLAMGMTTVQLAEELYLSHQGVAYHIGTMMRKFNVPNRTALASKAFSVGIFQDGYWPPKVVNDYISR